MTAQAFYKLVMSLWGEDWRPELRKLLAEHGIARNRRAIFNWQTGAIDVPDKVAEVLRVEKARRKSTG